MQLYYSPASPFSRIARVAALELGLAGQIDHIKAATRPDAPAPEVAAVNPLAKIPCLTRRGDHAIFDSRVICRYLNSQADGPLYPKPRIWQVMTLEALGQGITEAAVAIVYEGRMRPAEKVSDTWVESQWIKVESGLDAFQDNWMDHLNGPLTIAHITLACALGYIDFRHAARNWRDGRDTLAAWAAHFSTRPSMQSTQPTD